MEHLSPGSPGSSTVRFNSLWEAHAGRVLAYARRHVGDDAAQEVVAETFLVAWRRLADVPGEPLPWLLVVARNTVANQVRSGYRRVALAEELARIEMVARPAPGADVSALDRADTLAALALLPASHREALLLVAWDGLPPADAARVAGCSVAAFHVRLHRARKRLATAVVEPADEDPVRHPVRPSPTRSRSTT